MRYDEAKLAAAVAEAAAAIDREPVDATLTAEKGEYTTTDSVDGRTVDQAALLATLDAQLSPLDAPAEIEAEIPYTTQVPAFETADATTAIETADRMAQDLVLTRGDKEWTIKGSKLLPLITFSPTADGSFVPVVDRDGIKPLLKAVARDVDKAATERDVQGLRVAGRVLQGGQGRQEARPRCDPGRDPRGHDEPPGRPGGRRAGARRRGQGGDGHDRVRQADRAQDEADLEVDDVLPDLGPQRVRAEHLDSRPDHQRRGRRTRRDVQLLGHGRRGDPRQGLHRRRRDHQRQDRAPGRPRRWHLLVLHDAVQRGATSRLQDGRPAQPLLLHRPLPDGAGRHGVQVRLRLQPGHDLDERHQVPGPHPRHQHAERQLGLRDVLPVQRPDRPQGHRSARRT